MHAVSVSGQGPQGVDATGPSNGRHGQTARHRWCRASFVAATRSLIVATLAGKFVDVMIYLPPPLLEPLFLPRHDAAPQPIDGLAQVTTEA